LSDAGVRRVPPNQRRDEVVGALKETARAT
jgi:hypothetical protein